VASQEGISQDQMVDPGIDENLKTHSIGDTLARLPECARLASLVSEAGAGYLLNRSGMHTLFAPVDAALQGVTVREVEAFLTRHLLAGGSELSDLRLCKEVKTQSGGTLPVQVENDRVRVANTEIVRSDIPCTNGFIHVINGVFFTADAAASEAEAAHT
jgi:uncharacterized surface protein with fasciclin (FAS1) repeats